MTREITDKTEWDELVLANGGHPLQLWGWGELKAKHGWKVVRFELAHSPWAGAQVLLRTLPAPFGTFCYVPRGPVGKWGQTELDELSLHLKERFSTLAVSIEPHLETMPPLKGWNRARNDILLPRTLVLDLAQSEDELLARMSKKTRQYIRKSEKDGVTVRRAGEADLDACLAIYHDTANRANFSLHDDGYYKDIFALMAEHSPVYVAEYRDEIVAFLWLATSDSIAFELYGGVTELGQQVRANYILKWRAIATLKDHDVRYYDLNGLLNDGISTFKAGFSDQENQLVGTYDKALSPLYFVWDVGLPFMKKLIRTIKRR